MIRQRNEFILVRHAFLAQTPSETTHLREDVVGFFYVLTELADLATEPTSHVEIEFAPSTLET